MGIQNSALLVSVKLTSLGATRKDKTATDEVAAARHAQAKNLRVTKDLFPDNYYLSEIKKVDEELRAAVREYALPWNAAQWLLPTAHFMPLNDFLTQKVQLRETMVRGFITHYAQAMQESCARLGTLFDVNDYLPAEEAEQAFTTTISYEPIPESGDFRIDMEAEAMDMLRDSHELALANREKELAREAWDRIRAVCEPLVDRLTDNPDATNNTKTGSKVFRDTLVTNAEDLVSLLHGYNLSDDPAMHEVEAQLSQALHGVSPEKLRQSSTLRSEVASVAAQVLTTARNRMDNLSIDL